MDKSKIEQALVPVTVEQQSSREETVRDQFWPKFRAFAGQLPFAEDVAAAYFCATDKNVPFKVRGTLLAALAYFIMPLDFLPDILALVGFTDDIAVLTYAFSVVSQHITDDHRAAAREALREDEEAEPA